MEDVDEKYVLSDGERNLEIYYVQGLGSHVEGMLMAYLRKEKILIEADLFDPVDGGAPTSSAALHQALYDNVSQIGLEVETIAPIHGPAVAWSEFLKVVE